MTRSIWRIWLGVAIVLISTLTAMPALAEGSLDISSAKAFPLNLRPSSPEGAPEALPAQSIGLRTLPSSVDLSQNLPPVKSQGSQGSCAGWSVGYYFKTWQEQVERGWGTSSASHQFSPAFIYNQRATDNCLVDTGMTLGEAMSIVTSMGIASLDVFPYDVYDTCTLPNSQQIAQAWDYRTDSYGFIFLGNQLGNNPPDINDLKTRLANNEPFVVGIPVYSNFYGTGPDFLVDEPPSRYPLPSGHAMLVVGYDDVIGGFKVVNSWGTTYWGDAGFGYLSYDFVHNYAWEGWTMTDHVESGPATEPIDLAAGWNQIQLPADLAEGAVCDLFASVEDNLDKVWKLDQNAGDWVRFSPCVPGYVNTLTELDASDEIWLNVTQACTWDVPVSE